LPAAVVFAPYIALNLLPTGTYFVLQAHTATFHQMKYMKMQRNAEKKAETQFAESWNVRKVPRSMIRMYSGVPDRGKV
jgi:hypothetical protein